MAREKSALYQLGTYVLGLRDEMTVLASRDGVVDADEHAVIDGLVYIGRQLERGDRARLRSQAIENSWCLTDSPHMLRMIRETVSDTSDHDPDDGAPMLKAA